MANPTRAKLIFKVIAAVSARTAVLGTLMFFSAGTLSWWRGWVFLAVMFAASATMMLGVNQDLVAERLEGPFQKGSRADKILAVALIPAIAGQFVFIGLDVSRLHLLGKPNVIVSSLGLALCIAGFWIMHLGMRENAFATRSSGTKRSAGRWSWTPVRTTSCGIRCTPAESSFSSACPCGCSPPPARCWRSS